MTLTATLRVPQRNVEVSLTVPAAGTTAVVGPNGSGKSTILAAVAGLLQPPEALITLDGRILTQTHEGRPQVWVPPHQRRISLLGQQPRLFPHLDAAANVAFGLRAQGMGRRAAMARAQDWLERVGAAALAGSRPQHLSGGQASRVAIARALAVEPDLLLLDEPLAALDVEVVPALRSLLRSVTAGTTTVVVTHDVVDVVALADQIVVLDGGLVVEQGRAQDVLAAPRSRFGAALAGWNLVRGRWGDGVLHLVDGGVIRGRAAQLDPGEPAVARFRPAAVAVASQAPDGSSDNVFQVTVTAVEPNGGFLRVRATAAVGEVSADITASDGFDLSISPGRRVWFVVSPPQVSVHPAGSPPGQGRR